AKDTLLVLNKVDAADRGQLAAVQARYPHAVPISAHSGRGLDKLAAAVSQTLTHNFLDVDIETGVENGRLLAQLAAFGQILSKRYTDSRVIVHCRIPQRAMAHLHGDDIAVRQRAASTNGSTGGASNGFAPRLDWQLDSDSAPRLDPNSPQNGRS